MKLIDANLLLYAYNRAFDHHERTRAWLELTLSSPEPVRLCWPTITAFLRISTNPRAFEQPLATSEATEIVDSWFAQPQVELAAPGREHWRILRGLLEHHSIRGALVSDAHLASIAVENGAELCTSDRDFLRFEGLKVFNPLDASTV